MKKLLAILAAVGVMAFAVPAFAELTDTQKTEINKIYDQMHELRKQAIDKYVEAGDLTKEEANTIKERMDAAQKYRKENGITPGFGRGCGGGGRMGAGFGGGCGGAGWGGAGIGAQGAAGTGVAQEL